jgi:Na+/H+ antiporter NhaD/arsenite permease-like protein
MLWPMVLLIATLALLVIMSPSVVFPDYWDVEEHQPEERARDRKLIADAAVLLCAAVLAPLIVRRSPSLLTWRFALSMLAVVVATGATVAAIASPEARILGRPVRLGQYALALLALPAALRVGPGLAVPDITPKGVLTR